MTPQNFTTRRHCSCNGCYFKKDNCYTCLEKEQDLFIALGKLFGFCFKSEIIYITNLKP